MFLLRGQLEYYQVDIHYDLRFQNVSPLSKLCPLLVEIGMSKHYFFLLID